MSNYRNEDGEYLMTAAEIALEDALDAQSREEEDWDRFYDDYQPQDDEVAPEDCDHSDGSFPEDAGFDCDKCGLTLLGPRTEPYESNHFWWDDLFLNREKGSSIP